MDGAHTQDMLQMDRQLLFKEIPFDIRQIYLYFWAKMSGILISPCSPRYKGKSADLELPRAAAL